MRRIIPILMCLTALAAVSQTGTREALRTLCSDAAKGNATAIYHLARLHDTGYDSIPKDSIRAISLFRQAAEKGYAPAQNRLGYHLLHAQEQDTRLEGIEWLEKAAMQGDHTAESNLGWLLLGNEGVERNLDNARFWLERAAAAEVPAAQGMLAQILSAPNPPIAPDTLRAAALYEASINGGILSNTLPLIDLMREHWRRLTPAKALSTGLRFFRGRAPIIGVILFEQITDTTPHPPTSDIQANPAESNIQANPSKGEDTPFSSDEEREVYAEALYRLGDAYGRAVGVAYDPQHSLQYYYRAAVAGNAAARKIIAQLLDQYPDALDTLTTDPDHRSASYWYQLLPQ